MIGRSLVRGEDEPGWWAYLQLGSSAGPAGQGSGIAAARIAAENTAAAERAEGDRGLARQQELAVRASLGWSTPARSGAGHGWS